MRLCAILAAVLVALMVLTVKATSRRHRHATPPVDTAELGPPLRTAPTTPPPMRAPPARSELARIARSAPSAQISGRLRLPGGNDIAADLNARPTDTEQWVLTGDAGIDLFRLDGLVSGQRYDLEFSGTGLRALRLIGVVAPARDLDVALEPIARISVAVGFPRGERCPIDVVRLHVDSTADEWEVGGADHPDCRFELPAPDHAGPVTLIAAGIDLTLETTVIIPDHGDPEPICLNPPCRAYPLEGQARLRVMLDSASPRSPISATIVPIGDLTRMYSCASSRPRCHINSLLGGRAYAITASGRDCHGGPVTVTMAEGDNDVSVPCVRDPPPQVEPPSDPIGDVDS